MDSLDPRISRWQVSPVADDGVKKDTLDQLITYEVFLQQREGKPFVHAGIVHAGSLEMAFIFAKEQFSRRYTCTGMWVISTQDITVTPYTDLEENIYDLIEEDITEDEETKESYQVFHLMKRGKQHKLEGEVKASNSENALAMAKRSFDQGEPVLNVWVAKTADFLRSTEEDQAIWSTLKEKTHREVISYKAGDRLKAFKEQNS